MRKRGRYLIPIALVALVGGMAVWASASQPEDASDPDAGNPVSAHVDYDAALAGAPPELARLYRRGDRLVEGGQGALDRLLDGVRGHPAVVNVWASWCKPCRDEFPYFQELVAEEGKRVAFMAVNSEDGDATARTFLDQFPVPFPSVTDPDGEIANDLGLVGLPGTAFYSPDGELEYVHNGPYANREQLAADLERYASKPDG